MASCPLFWLPQELRDKIYLYALYNEDGLHFQTCSHGVSRLCKKPKSSRTISHWLRRLKLNRKCNTYTRDNNQLKYVCKRLRYETNKLDLLYNCIIFKDNANEDALQQCMFLLYSCPVLQEVAIKCTLKSFQSNYNRQGFSAIVRYCQVNTKVRARIYIPYWSQLDPNFTLIGLHFLHTLRANPSTITLSVRSIIESYRLDLSTTQIYMPSNIRIFPNEEKFCQQTFEQSCRLNPSVRLPTDEAVLAEVMKEVESWFKCGL